MNSGNIIIHTNQMSVNKIQGQILKDGTSVLVRIVSDKGNDEYEGFVGGAKVNLHSSKKFLPGATFPATIGQKNGVIIVTPKQNEFLNEKDFSVKFLQNNQLAGLLNKLGIENDEISLHLLLEMKQMEVKIDTKLINRIKTIALKYGKKSRLAAEIMMILEQKGLNASQEEISLLIKLLENETDGNHSEDDYELLNKINKTKGSWYILPFNLMDYRTNKQLGNGFVNLLEVNQNLKQMNVEFYYREAGFFFNIPFSLKKCERIFCGFENLIDSDIRKIVDDLKEKFNPLNIEIKELAADVLKGTGCETEELLEAGGLI